MKNKSQANPVYVVGIALLFVYLFWGGTFGPHLISPAFLCDPTWLWPT